MRALLIERFGVTPAVHDVPDPVCPPDGAVVRVEATGLCRSDWHALAGHDPDVVLPHVPGHEFAGVLESVGADVPGWRPGDRVTAPFVHACGACSVCRSGDHQVCPQQTQPGFSHWGSFAERVVVRQAAVNLVALPPEVDAVTAAALGCRYATAYRAVVQVGRVRPGEWVAVHGCGGVGLSAVQVAHQAGARVVAVDVRAEALAAASALGAERTVLATAPAGTAPVTDAAGQVPDAGQVTDAEPGAGVAGRAADDAERVADVSGQVAEAAASVADAVREATGGGAQLSLDALGSTATAAASIGCLRPRGRHVQVGLLPAVLGWPALPLHLMISGELELLGSHGMAAHAYPQLLGLVVSGRLRPDLLVTGRIGLDAAGPALAAMGQRPPTGVTVILPGR